MPNAKYMLSHYTLSKSTFNSLSIDLIVPVFKSFEPWLGIDAVVLVAGFIHISCELLVDLSFSQPNSRNFFVNFLKFTILQSLNTAAENLHCFSKKFAHQGF